MSVAELTSSYHRYRPSVSVVLMVSLCALLVVSLLMIASASAPFAIKEGREPLYYFMSQLKYIGLGGVLAYVAYKISPLHYLEFKKVIVIWLFVIVLLVLTLFQEEVNGATRWIRVGPVSIQVAEIVKLVSVILMSEYIARRLGELKLKPSSVARLSIWYLPVTGLLMLQPDFGSTVVILGTSVLMLFVAGVSKKHYFVTLMALALVAGMAIFSEDYRRERVLSFMDPFDDVQDTDYQLSRSLVAFGRGEINGVGYGNSIQKLSHLPEAHTDFILAITGEELGFLGVLFVLFLEFCIIATVMKISHTMLMRNQLRLSYMTFGFGVILFAQVFINVGMNIGVLPTKGLTLPFYSYGGSSLVTFMIMIGLILRAEKESAIANQKGINSRY